MLGLSETGHVLVCMVIDQPLHFYQKTIHSFTEILINMLKMTFFGLFSKTVILKQLLATDHSALASMKSVANCEN